MTLATLSIGACSTTSNLETMELTSITVPLPRLPFDPANDEVLPDVELTAMICFKSVFND